MYINNNNKNDLKFQDVNSYGEVLTDFKRDGKERPWKEKKLKSLELSQSYLRLDLESKHVRSHQCCNFLEFKVFEDGTKKLNKANNCKLRLCSLCAWRRTLKIFSQVSKVINHLNKNNDYKFLFLTLTCKNVKGEELDNQLDILFNSFKKLFQRKDVSKSVKGWFRALEVTHDVHKKITNKMYQKSKQHYDSLGLYKGSINPNFDMYHPHFHIILMVNKSYFKNKDYYITQEKWTSLWQESLGVDYTPVVDIRSFKLNNSKAVSEVAKYSVKDNDYLVRKDKDLTDKTVFILDGALRYRRLVAFGGLMKKAHKELNLTKLEDDSDLVHIDDDNENETNNINYVLETYNWNIGYSNYIKFILFSSFR